MKVETPQYLFQLEKAKKVSNFRKFEKRGFKLI